MVACVGGKELGSGRADCLGKYIVERRRPVATVTAVWPDERVDGKIQGPVVEAGGRELREGVDRSGYAGDIRVGAKSGSRNGSKAAGLVIETGAQFAIRRDVSRCKKQHKLNAA